MIDTQKLKEEGFKDLGWMNGWKEKPPEYKACADLMHSKFQFDNSRTPGRGTEIVCACRICKFFYRVDMSD